MIAAWAKPLSPAHQSPVKNVCLAHLACVVLCSACSLCKFQCYSELDAGCTLPGDVFLFECDGIDRRD